jgi:hypothetical protein
VNIWLILAAASTPAPSLKDLPDYSRGSRLVVSDLTLVIGLIGLIVTALVVWARFIRGPKKHPDEDHQPNLQSNVKPAVTVTEDGRERHRKKKRVRRRDHRHRNPTLDQVGGLPPPRDPQESPSV